MIFYLGTHRIAFFQQTDVPLFASRRILHKRKSFPRALGRWSLDSGGFSELSLYGGWQTSPSQYIQEINRFQSEIGNLDWASQQDYMCEPHMIKKTGLTVKIHQERTIDNLIELRSMNTNVPIIPVLQGWCVNDYLQHIEMWEKRGIDLRQEPTVGVGSVCRRSSIYDIVDIIVNVHKSGIKNIHGFGVKSSGVSRIGHLIQSCDSMAWSLTARFDKTPCPYGKRNCAHCLHYALSWREKLLKAESKTLVSLF